jgi:RNA polymerase sigma factor (sigma-70 family)
MQELAETLAALRPNLHRYCARLMGSVFDGEDIVQDVMVRALEEANRRPEGTPLRPWLFRVAHNRAIDVIRTKAARARLTPMEPESESMDDADPFEILAQRQAVALAIDRFAELPTLQRSVVILKDVLGETNEDIEIATGLSLQSVKAHLHRGRLRLIALTHAQPTSRPPVAPSSEVLAFISLFNARDWAQLRRLLVEDVRLIQTTKTTIVGREAVARRFFTGYEASTGWALRAGSVEGREVIWVSDAEGADYIMLLGWCASRLASIIDFRYARYVAKDIRDDAEKIDQSSAGQGAV